jgi:hypothetical protein
MFDHTHYVPVLKAKKGELDALEELSTRVRDSLTPLIELPDIPWDFEDEAPAKTVDQHLQKIPKRLADAWGAAGRPLFVDLGLLDPGDRLATGDHPLAYVGHVCHQHGLQIIPVTGLRRDADYQSAVDRVSKQHGAGVALRVSPEDFDDVIDDPGVLPRCLPRTILLDKADLIVDLGAISGQQLAALELAAKTALRGIPTLSAWRTLTLAGGAFPQNLSAFDRGFSAIDRYDWELWQSITTWASQKHLRIPTFGDYAIQSAGEIEDVDPRVMRMSASLRYALADTWLIVKGRNVKDHTYEEFRRVCQGLLQRAEFKGAAHCPGDMQLDRCGQGVVSTGNATTWRRAGTTHHITVVVDQIASLAAPSSTP